MPFDFKKEYKEFYLPPAKPVIVIVPNELQKWKTVIRHPIKKM